MREDDLHAILRREYLDWRRQGMDASLDDALLHRMARAALAAAEARVAEVVAERDQSRKRADELYRDFLHHMNKWQDDRQELMRLAPGYDYKNRVDDPEWAKAKAAIVGALGAAGGERADG